MLIWFLPVFLVFLLLGLPVLFACFAPGTWLNGQERDMSGIEMSIMAAFR